MKKEVCTFISTSKVVHKIKIIWDSSFIRSKQWFRGECNWKQDYKAHCSFITLNKIKNKFQCHKSHFSINVICDMQIRNSIDRSKSHCFQVTSDVCIFLHAFFIPSDAIRANQKMERQGQGLQSPCLKKNSSWWQRKFSNLHAPCKRLRNHLTRNQRQPRVTIKVSLTGGHSSGGYLLLLCCKTYKLISKQ